MTLILAIDAAWTEKEPSGIALVAGHGNQWKCLCVAPSYDAFVNCTHGKSINWSSDKFFGGRPDVKQLLGAAQAKADARVDLVALDMPVAKVPFSSRRVADNEISKAFGGRGCSAHSPTKSRPGLLGRRLSDGLREAGYPIATAGDERALGRTIEVYPHPALLTLLSVQYRFPYKISKSTRYWDGKKDVQERISLLLERFAVIEHALCGFFEKSGIPLPRPPKVQTLEMLKRYEDALDALVCAWVGAQFVIGNVKAYGDETAAIWVPLEK